MLSVNSRIHACQCDDLCANAIPWLAVVQGMMAAYFPDEPNGVPDQVH